MQILPSAEGVLHFSESKNWFNSRHTNKTKEKYLKTDKELFDDVIVTETFHLIDRDHSNSIELDELYTMLKKNNYPVNMSLLKTFFDKTDRDGNKCIDLDEFKQVIKDEQTSQTFRILMRKMREIGDENYYSTDFVNLLRYLYYCSNRTDLIFQIKNTRLSFQVRSKLVSDLFKIIISNSRLIIYTQTIYEKEDINRIQISYTNPKKTKFIIKSFNQYIYLNNLITITQIISKKIFDQHITSPLQSTKSTLQSTQTTQRKNYNNKF